MNLLTTRKKAAFLRKLGFAKSRMQMTRAGTTYMKGRAMVTIAKGDQGGGGWILVSPGFTLQAMMMNVENLKDGFRARLEDYRADDPSCPDPAREDYGTGAYRDDLFRWAAATVAARH